MIVIPDALQARLDADATTLAWCWRMTRRDGAVFAFTEHDEPLTLNGEVFEAAAGVSPGAMRSEMGMNAARSAVFGALSSQRIRAADLDNGVWDGARVEIFRADWREPDLFWRVATGELGQIVRTRNGFEAELAGLSARLNRRIGRVYSRACDAELGDARCRADLSDPRWTGTGEVVFLDANGRVEVSGLDAFAPGLFTGGVLSWTSGENRPGRVRVREHRLEDGKAILILASSQAAPVRPGDGFTVRAGCDKQAETCRARFENFANFRGHPHMPGNDVLQRHPAREADRDGGRRG